MGEEGEVWAPSLFDLIASCQHRGIKSPTIGDMVNEFSSLELMNRNKKTGLVTDSWGADFGWEYAARNRREVEWMVAASPTGWPLGRSLTDWIPEFIRMMYDASRTPQEIQKNDAGTDPLMQQFRKDKASVLHGILNLAANSDSRDVFPRVETSVVMLRGVKDRYIPLYSTQRIAASLSHAGVAIVSPHGHLWPGFDREQLIRPVVQLARSTSGSRSPS